jgi:hypothetical protein
MSAPVFEAFDRERYQGALDLYEIPSFQAKGKKAPVKVAPTKKPKPQVEYEERQFWHVVPNNLIEDTKTYNRYLREMLEFWKIPPQGPRGMLWREPGRWCLSVHDDTKWYGWTFWDNFTSRRAVKGATGEFEFKHVITVPGMDVATARLIPASQVREQMKNDIRTAILDHMQSQGPVGSASFIDQLNSKVEAQIEKDFKITNLGAMVIDVAALGAGSWVYVAEGGPEWSGIAQLAPLTKLQKLPKRVPDEKEDEAADASIGTEGAGEEGDGALGGAGKAGAKGTGKPTGKVGTRKAGGKAGAGEGKARKEGKSPEALGGYGSPGGVPSEVEMAKAFGFVYSGEEKGPGTGSTFPGTMGGDQAAICDSPFNGEPSYKELGADGELLRQVIEDIARRLQIKPVNGRGTVLVACKCKRAGGFRLRSMHGGHHLGFSSPSRPSPAASARSLIPGFARHRPCGTPGVAPNSI